jgi:hypothetical protein
MSRVASRSSIDHLELNPSAFANKLPTYLHAKQSNRRGESSVGQDMMRFYVMMLSRATFADALGLGNISTPSRSLEEPRRAKSNAFPALWKP